LITQHNSYKKKTTII